MCKNDFFPLCLFVLGWDGRLVKRVDDFWRIEEDNATCTVLRCVGLDQEQLEQAAQELIAAAIVANPPIEYKLKYLADVCGGAMSGLEFKIKPLRSLVRKMMNMYSPPMTPRKLVSEAVRCPSIHDDTAERRVRIKCEAGAE